MLLYALPRVSSGSPWYLTSFLLLTFCCLLLAFQTFLLKPFFTKNLIGGSTSQSGTKLVFYLFYLARKRCVLLVTKVLDYIQLKLGYVLYFCICLYTICFLRFVLSAAFPGIMSVIDFWSFMLSFVRVICLLSHWTVPLFLLCLHYSIYFSVLQYVNSTKLLKYFCILQRLWALWTIWCWQAYVCYVILYVLGLAFARSPQLLLFLR